jgi:hypothetical protein
METGSKAESAESGEESSGKQQGPVSDATSEPAEGASGRGPESGTQTARDLPGGVQTTGEREAGLDRELDQSLSEFDGLLLKEQELLEAQRQETASAVASAGGGAGEEGPGGSGGGDSDGADRAESESGASGGSPDSPAGEPVDPTGGSVEGRTDNGRVPPDVGDGSDDDIVARQLREAAEKEEDPELREKLWDEYRAYKSGVKKKG